MTKKRLTEEQVINIYNDERKYKEIAEHYCVKYATVVSIKNGYSWYEITRKIPIKEKERP